MKHDFGNNAKLLHIDTDKQICDIRVPDFFYLIPIDFQEYDTSDYPTNNVDDIPLTNNMMK